MLPIYFVWITLCLSQVVFLLSSPPIRSLSFKSIYIISRKSSSLNSLSSLEYFSWPFFKSKFFKFVPSWGQRFWIYIFIFIIIDLRNFLANPSKDFHFFLWLRHILYSPFAFILCRLVLLIHILSLSLTVKCNRINLGLRGLDWLEACQWLWGQMTVDTKIFGAGSNCQIDEYD